jgi:hypothetical protein
MKFNYTYIFFIGWFFVSSLAIAQQTATDLEIKSLTKEVEYEAGSEINLKFSNSGAEKPLLYCSNSYGSTLVTPSLNGDILNYKIPLIICSKKGQVNWKLLTTHSSISGQFYLKAKENVATMETYIGPPSIEAGGQDYTMLVVVPTDSLDNPVSENTLVNVSHQFLDAEESDQIVTKNLIAHKNLFSKKESGRMLVSSESLGTNSKEFTINVTPAIPSDFTIFSKRPHSYADGNQITTFITSVIKDKQNNVVSDGTFVSFFITNKNGNILRTSGTTISGIAQSKMIHPDYEDNWSVKAYIEGMAESNTITINYTQVINDFEVAFSNNNRDLTVGPLQSFMGQMIPDGLQVEFKIYKGNTLLENYTKTSFNGFAHLNLKTAIFENDVYKIVVRVAGIEKTFDNKELW